MDSGDEVGIEIGVEMKAKWGAQMCKETAKAVYG